MTRRWFGGAIVGAMLLFTLAIWSLLPERIPTHWNLRGEVDGWSPRWPGALLIPGLSLGLWLLLPVLRKVDPRRAHYERFEETFFLLVNVIVLYMAVLHVLAMGAALGWDVDMSRAMMAMLGVTFMAIGNFLPRVRSNWWMGVRTPWTLDSEKVWRETHRLAGWTFVAGGAVAVIATLLPHPARMPLAFAGLVAAGTIPVVWSYVLWRRYGEDEA